MRITLRSFVAFCLSWALSAVPGVAWAQMQSVPVTQAKSTVKQIYCGSTFCTPAVSSPTAVEDWSGYASIEFFSLDCGTGSVAIYGGGVYTSIQYVEGPGTIFYLDKKTNGQSWTMPIYYQYNKVYTTTSKVDDCRIWAILSPIASTATIRGAIADGRKIDNVPQDSMTGNYPVIVGGVDGDTGLVQTFSLDSTGALKTAGGSTAISYAPGVPTLVTLAAVNTSYSLCGLTAGADYEISCNVPASWRHGAATPTATLNDNQLPANTIRSPLRMPAGSTCFAFISGSLGYCFVSLIPTS